MFGVPSTDAPPQRHYLVLSAHWIDRPIWLEEATRMEVQVSPAARIALREAGMLVATLLKRHFTGDWGSVDPAVAAANEEACHGGRLVVSVHRAAGADVRVETFSGHTLTLISLGEGVPRHKRRDHLRRVPPR